MIKKKYANTCTCPNLVHQTCVYCLVINTYRYCFNYTRLSQIGIFEVS